MQREKRDPRASEAKPMNYRSHSGRQRWTAGKAGCYALSLLALLILGSCGSGGADSVAGGGTGGTGTVSVGPISDLGSIFVNGIEFDISKASVDVNGSQAAGGMLQRGMVVTVDGTVNADGRTGVANSVVYDDNVQGPISAIDQASGTFTVLGQTIHTDSETLFATGGPSPGLADLSLGDFVEVSGLPTADGSIHATRISLPAAGDQVQITGPVSGAMGTTFMINGLTVDISQVASGMGMSQMNGNGQQNGGNGSGPQNGDVVAVTGALDGDGVLIASQLRRMTPLPAANRQMQLAGYIQTATADSFTIAASMMMGTMTVQIDQGTVFTGGSAADLKPGVRVGVTGSMSMGTITAQEISL
jgi:hypothetical protein